MKKLYETALILFGTLGWWGFVYPEFCLSGDRYEQEASAGEETEEQESSEMEAQTDGKKVVCMEAEGDVSEPSEAGEERQEKGTESCAETGLKVGDICIKSRIVEYVYRIPEHAEAEERTENAQQKCAGGSL